MIFVKTKNGGLPCQITHLCSNKGRLSIFLFILSFIVTPDEHFRRLNHFLGKTGGFWVETKKNEMLRFKNASQKRQYLLNCQKV